MATVVTLDVFSGRQNPSLQLTGANEQELHARIAAATATTHQRPSGVVGGLGYRGFLISSHDATLTAAGRLRVHEGIVDRGINLANVVDDAEIERFLFALFKLPQPVHDHVHDSMMQAVQFGSGTAVTPCPTCHAADAPAYDPAPWNNPTAQPNNNCYNYANDHPTNTFAQPGRAHGHEAKVLDCAHVQPAAVADGLYAVPNFAAPLEADAGWYAALVVWPGADYHWYRQDKSGCWTHKPGTTAARDVDNAGHSISDPQTCNRGPYTAFCSYMVTKRGVSIA